MLRFIFSFCGTSGDAPEAESKEEGKRTQFKLVFMRVRKLANEPDSPMWENLSCAQVPVIARPCTR